MRSHVAFLAAAVSIAVPLSGCSTTSSTTTPSVVSTTPASPTPGRISGGPASIKDFQSNINHIIVISQENWSFDGLYGNFPGANGLSSAISATQQVDANGNVITVLPQVLIGTTPQPAPATPAPNPDPRFPQNLPAAPFNLANYVPPDSTTFTGDPNHNFYLQQYQIDGTPPTSAQPGAGGKMDRYLAFASIPTNGTQGGLPMGFYDATNMPEGKIAQQYVLMDNFRQATFGGSFINNVWLFCACILQIPNAPAKIVEQYDSFGNPLQYGSPEGRVTGPADPAGAGNAVNTMFPANYPQISGSTPGDPNRLVPPQSAPTIGDRLSAANVAWKWYSGGLTQALAGTPDKTFQAHHQAPFFFSNYAPGTAGANNVVDMSQFFTDLAAGQLPAVSFVKNLGAYNEHPGYTNLLAGQLYTTQVVNQIMMSPTWADTMIIIYYDEAGGHYDHVAPTPQDRWGPATRVPALVISPWAVRGGIDHTAYDTTSILATIEQRFGLAPLGTRDAAAAPLLGGLNFNQTKTSAVARRPFNITNPPPKPPAPTSATGHYPVTELDD